MRQPVIKTPLYHEPSFFKNHSLAMSSRFKKMHKSQIFRDFNYFGSENRNGILINR